MSTLIERTPLSWLHWPSWLEIEWLPAPSGTDYSVRRVAEIPFAFAVNAIATIHGDLVERPNSRRGTEAVIRAESTWLAFADPGAVAGTATDEVRLPAVLHVHRFGPPLPVEFIIEPWSPARTELRLQARTRRGKLRLPKRYYDAAHPVMVALRDEIEARAAA